MGDHSLSIVIGGEAGQGLVTLGQLLSKSLVRSGYFILVTQDYLSRVRGGHNTFRLRTAVHEIHGPAETIDLLIALDQQTIALHRPELSPQGLMILDEDFHLKDEPCPCIKVPFKKLADNKFANVLALGVAGALLGLIPETLARVVDEFFGHKNAALVDSNRKALQAAYQWMEKQDFSFPKLEPAQGEPRLMLNGNEAIALGALSAGLKFLSFYPMTPATSIALTVAAQAQNMGIMVEQAEDEIAAINMALGASFAGAPSMVSTSGGGFALMVEGVSLAGMTETPIVIVVGQRPGPATGLPTRTEQADLEFILHAGHGEFPRAILTPGTVEQCFYLTRKAFELAEAYQSPVFLLTDQFLADCYRAVAPFPTKDLPAILPGAGPQETPEPYRRYALSGNGISTRLLPGLSQHLVIADSDEHTEDGHLTEDLSVRRQMVEKRLRKAAGLTQEVIPPEYLGGLEPELLLVAWGSTCGAVQEAVQRLSETGKAVAALLFSQVWPLIPDHFLSYLEKARQVIGVEGNALGQLARLIRRETGFHIGKNIHRYDGLPITAEYIIKNMSSLQM
jgi:2-oxoglutarate/2-oxoacid ferredoxin oxidoreductase subunit alpha